VAICREHGLGPCKKWVDDFVFLRQTRPDGSPEYLLEEILALGDNLGWPWKAKKTRPFASLFRYLGFEWSLSEKVVAIPPEKKAKYLQRLAVWTPSAQISQKCASKTLGTLVHCTLAVPDGRSHLGELIRFSSGLDSARSRHVCWTPRPELLRDIEFWRGQLSSDFCGSSVREPPVASDIEFWVDASTSWGIGVVFKGTWQSWRLKEGWKEDGRDIGWAEMIAIELGLRLAVAMGYRNIHFIVKSDNMGVIGALDGGRSRNREQNSALQRIVAIMRQHGFWMTSLYVQSARNIADRPSRGLPAVFRRRSKAAVKIPGCLSRYMELANMDLT
jgi:hypothetical protein